MNILVTHPGDTRPRVTSLPKDDRAEAMWVKDDRAPKSFGRPSDDERRTTVKDDGLCDEEPMGDVRLALRRLHLLGMHLFGSMRPGVKGTSGAATQASTNE